MVSIHRRRWTKSSVTNNKRSIFHIFQKDVKNYLEVPLQSVMMVPARCISGRLSDCSTAALQHMWGDQAAAAGQEVSSVSHCSCSSLQHCSNLEQLPTCCSAAVRVICSNLVTLCVPDPCVAAVLQCCSVEALLQCQQIKWNCLQLQCCRLQAAAVLCIELCKQ